MIFWDAFASVIALLILILIEVAGGQQSSSACSIVNNLDCSQDPPSLLCASNGVSYPTRCEFAKAHCTDGGIRLLHSGHCQDSDLPDPACHDLATFTCPASNTLHVCANDGKTYDSLCVYHQARCQNATLQLVSLGSCEGTVHTIICQAILQQACPADSSQVCGSDGNTYDNACELEKAACQADGIHMVSDKAC